MAKHVGKIIADHLSAKFPELYFNVYIPVGKGFVYDGKSYQVDFYIDICTPTKEYKKARISLLFWNNTITHIFKCSNDGRRYVGNQRYGLSLYDTAAIKKLEAIIYDDCKRTTVLSSS